MLEYFGFYAPAPESNELDASQREAVMARAAQLAERSRHTPSAVPVGRAWERTPPRGRELATRPVP